MRQVDWRALRGSIVLFVLALVIGGTTAGTATWFHDEARRGYERQKGRLETIRSRYRTIDEEKRLIETWLPEFRVLQAAGIIGEERRLVWIEALQAIAARLRLPSLQYRIEPRTAYDGELDLDTGDYRPFSTVVRLEAGLLHEGDVERLFEDLAIRNTGLYRIERCEIRRAGPNFVMRAGAVNLTAECDLRWITLARIGAQQQ